MEENEYDNLSKNSEENALFVLYRDKLKKFLYKHKNKKGLLKWEIYDALISLHFCFEYQINNFFRDTLLFFDNDMNPKNRAKLISWFLDKISYWQKVAMFLYLWQYNSARNFNKLELIDSMRNFWTVRNILFHWGEVDTEYSSILWSNSIPNYYHDLPWGEFVYSKITTFNIDDFIRQKNDYENLLKKFKDFCLKSSFFWKNAVERINYNLKSIFDDL